MTDTVQGSNNLKNIKSLATDDWTPQSDISFTNTLFNFYPLQLLIKIFFKTFVLVAAFVQVDDTLAAPPRYVFLH